jgi:hypothetical protein
MSRITFSINFTGVPIAVRKALAPVIIETLEKNGWVMDKLEVLSSNIFDVDDDVYLSLGEISHRDSWCYSRLGGSGSKFELLAGWNQWSVIKCVKPIPDISIKLNSEYTALVSTENVKVGCQTFDFNAVLDLAAAVKKQLANKQ